MQRVKQSFLNPTKCNSFLRRSFSNFGYFTVPSVVNEPFQNYAPGSSERQALKEALKKCRDECPEIPMIIGGKEVKSKNVMKQVMPSDHSHTLCHYYNATKEDILAAIQASMDAKPRWESLTIDQRLSIFTRASWLLSKVYRYELMAATMLGTGKNVWQAEIDASLELTDFWRFGAKYCEDMYKQQPTHHDNGVWNRLEYRPLEGFCLAISPFNFVAIGGNLCATPAMVGNTVIWKPASTSILSNYKVYQILREAGLPKGVINFLPSQGSMISEYAIKDMNLAAVNFTGSTQVFRSIWQTIGNNIEKYKSYPRIVGETGGKNFHFVHYTADIETVVNATIRGAFEYNGQKCSATSRMFVPKSIWKQVKSRLIEEAQKIKVGQPDDFESFVTAVIDKSSFSNIKQYIEYAKNSKTCNIITGGNYDDSKGYFISPTIIETTDIESKIMKEEIFGPVLSCFIYDDDKFEETLTLCDTSCEYALTGSFFANCRFAIDIALKKLRQSAGNFYINDKSTGAIVGQQPFGGSRGSGTNDKAGFSTIYSRFVSLRSIKETYIPTKQWTYPHMAK